MIVETSNRLEAREAVRAFKALADENRMAIFELVRERCTDDGCDTTEAGIERTVSEIAKRFDLALSTVSHHLKELRNAGLVTCEKHGQRVHCSVNWEVLEGLHSFLARPCRVSSEGSEDSQIVNQLTGGPHG
jgi:DNA-binding transcriptional ArsR family regulator